MHPPFDTLTPGLTFDPPSSLLGGEALLVSVYNAIRNSSSVTGSNYLNTTLLVTFDEHGGTYDHVQPPSAVPPHAGAAPGQWGFKFDRSGVRIPTLAVSAWIPERTVVNDEHRATSLIATMRERWNLVPPLTARDASARSFATTKLFSLSTPRKQEDWPEIVARPVPKEGPAWLSPLDAPLGVLGKSLVAGCLALGRGMGEESARIRPGHDDHRGARTGHDGPSVGGAFSKTARLGSSRTTAFWELSVRPLLAEAVWKRVW